MTVHAQTLLVTVADALTTERFRVGKLDSSAYAASGPYPIVDQGQDPIAGYTDREDLLYEGPLPVVIFGDHTRAVKFVDQRFVAGADGTKVLAPDTTRFDPLYFYFALKGLDIPSRGYNRHWALLREMTVPRPPLAEQCRIARILSTILRSEGATADSLHAVQKLKVAFKRYCLDYPTESGTNVHLRDLDGAIETGPFGSQLHASEYERTGIRVLNPIHLCENGVNPDVEPVYVSEDTASRLSRHRLQKGDVVVPRRGDLSRYVLVRGDLVGELCGTGSIKVRLNDQRVSPAYFALYYGSEIAQSYIRDAATGTIMPNISPRVLEGMPIYLPEREIQDRFVKGWEAIDAIERALVLHLKHIGLVFGASLSLLFGDDLS